MNTTLLLLPGMDGTDVFFRPLIEALPPFVRTIVVSLPTTGGSDYADLLDYVRQKVAQLSEQVDELRFQQMQHMQKVHTQTDTHTQTPTSTSSLASTSTGTPTSWGRKGWR